MSLLEAAGTVGSTSCSVSMKNLTKTPIFCDGSTLVLLTSPAGASNSTSTTRSLFGGGGGLSGLRCKNPLGTFFPSCLVYQSFWEKMPPMQFHSSDLCA